MAKEEDAPEEGAAALDVRQRLANILDPPSAAEAAVEGSEKASAASEEVEYASQEEHEDEVTESEEEEEAMQQVSRSGRLSAAPEIFQPGGNPNVLSSSAKKRPRSAN